MMTTWCQEFNFTINDGGFIAVPNSSTGQVSTWSVAGWQGYFHPAYGPDSKNEIRKTFQSATIVKIEMEAYTSGPFCDPYGCTYIIATGNLTLGSFTPLAGTHLYTWLGSLELTEITLVQYESQQPTILITKVTIYGTGTNPFDTATPQETQTQQALDSAFVTLRDAFQANPTATLTTQIANYKAAIQNAFGVSFTKSGTATDWDMRSLFFAHRGLESIALAFENWIRAQNPCIGLNRYAIFQRVMGSMEFNNVTTVQTNFASTAGHVVTVYRRSATVQAIMTPSNLIHELGHALDGFSGFGYKVIGSMLDAINVAQLPTTRVGMGQPYLRVQFYEHATISAATSPPATSDAKFTLIAGKQPPIFNKTGYLLYDLIGDKYKTWSSAAYTTLYGGNARIDTNVQNAAANPNETAADSFLNWVITLRNSYLSPVLGFDTSATGQLWSQFYATNIGIFLRNAAILQKGMIAHYQQRNIIPLSPLTTGSRAQDTYKIRLTPSDLLSVNNIIGSAVNIIPQAGISIYGWWIPSVSIGDGSPYWLLVASNSGLLVWLGSNGVNHNQTTLMQYSQIADPTLLSPIRSFQSSDIYTIIGG